MDSPVELRNVPPRHALVVHARCPLASIGATVGPLFGEVMSWAGAHHVPIAGPAITRYVSLQDGVCEMDTGFIVPASPADADARVRAVDLGDCTAACVTHMGSYESLAGSYAAIEKWIAENGYVTAGAMWEEYFSPPGTPPEQTRTDIYWPVTKKPGRS